MELEFQVGAHYVPRLCVSTAVANWRFSIDEFLKPLPCLDGLGSSTLLYTLLAVPVLAPCRPLLLLCSLPCVAPGRVGGNPTFLPCSAPLVYICARKC